MTILFVPYGTERAPATRYRVMQYLPYLASRGIGTRVFSSISHFSTDLMIQSPDFGSISKFLYYIYVSLERFFRLIYVIVIAKRFDAIFLQRTTFLFKFEILLKKMNANIIFDIDDAIYLPDKEANDIVTRMKRWMKKWEVVNILKVSRVVIVENDYIKSFVSQYCSDVIKIPGPIDTVRFLSAPKDDSSPKVVIGWIGSPATTGYLHMLDNVFKTIQEKFNFVTFKFIGLGRYSNCAISFEKVEWSYDGEIRELQSFDIGVMPMPDNNWTKGKLGCKMLQYMAVGIPTVVSYTSTNAEIISDGENGFFAVTEDEWLRALSSLIENPELRGSIGGRGRRTVVEKCSLDHNVDKLIGILKA